MTYESSHFRPLLGNIPLWLIRLLAATAAGLAGYLSWKSFSHGPIVGCSGAELVDCESVLATHWSRMLGIPVALLGTTVYLGVFFASWFAGTRHVRTARFGIFTLTLLTAVAVASAVWFSGLQFMVLEEYCIFCLATHACGIFIAIILAIGLAPACAEARQSQKPIGALQSALAVRPATRSPAPQSTVITGLGQFVLPASLGLLATSGMMAAQWFGPAVSHQVADAGEISGSFNMDSESPAVVNATDSAGAHVVHRVAPEEVDLKGALANSVDEPLALTVTETNQPESVDTSTDEEQNASVDRGDEDSSKRVIDLSFINEKKSRNVQLLDGKISFDIYEQAYIGSPESPYVMIELFDYTCKHCRKVHEMVVNSRYRYRGQLTVVAMPVPLEIKCNPLMRRASTSHRGACKLATLALAVGKLNPRAFEGFHDWLMADKDRSRSYDASLIRTYDTLGRDRIRNVLASNEFADRIRRHVNLYGNLSKQWKGEKGFGLPVLIVGNKISSGTLDYEVDLHELLESGLGIEPVR